MASTLDLTNVEFTFEQVKGIKEAIWEKVFNNPALEQFHTVVPGIVAKRQIVILGLLGLSGKKSAGCAPDENPNRIPSSEKFWDPQYIEDRFVECFKDLLDKFTVYGLKSGVEKADLTDTDFANFLESRVGVAMLEAILRLIWFGDITAENVADGGVITDGVDVEYFTPIDGFFKQIFAIVAANPEQRVTIAKNAGATYAAQRFDTTDTTNRVATNILQGLLDNADERLVDTNVEGEPEADVFIVATKSLVDQYKRERRANDNVDIAYERTETGFKYIEIDGVRVFAFNFWDRTIKAYQDNGTKYNLPHRAVLLDRRNMQVGVEEENDLAQLDIFYDKRNKEMVMDYGFNLDAVLVEDYRVMAAY
ncbi:MULTISPECIES: hypothetical protein [Olivibacter]|uniref:Major capsid protein n=1 Tax=Olivibacter jilunii TaxID=985016 RepID=A0ABW6AWK3_9SPHI